MAKLRAGLENLATQSAVDMFAAFVRRVFRYRRAFVCRYVPHLAPFAAESLGSNDASPHDHRDLLVVVAEELLSPLMAGPDDERDSDDVAASFVRRNDARAAAQPKRTRLSSRAVGLAVAFNAAFLGSVSLHPDAVRRNARSLALRALQDVAPLLLAKTKIALHARAIIGVAGPDFDSALHVAVAECIVRELVAHMCASYVRDAVRRSTSLTQDLRMVAIARRCVRPYQRFPNRAQTLHRRRR